MLTVGCVGGRRRRRAQRRRRGIVLAQKGKDWVNLAEYLVLNGLAEVMKHRADDARSAHYDKLLGAEISATGSSRQYPAFLKRAGTTKAIITYVMAGYRFRAYVPAENCTTAGDKYGETAKQFTRLRLLQREVTIWRCSTRSSSTRWSSSSSACRAPSSSTACSTSATSRA
jgi:hypothetical protein